MGGKGDPAKAPEAEQDRRAAALFAAGGHVARGRSAATDDLKLRAGEREYVRGGTGARRPALYLHRSRFGAGRIRSVRAGAPATTALSGTSFVTTVFVPTRSCRRP